MNTEPLNEPLERRHHALEERASSPPRRGGTVVPGLRRRERGRL